MPPAESTGSDSVKRANGRFHIMSSWDTLEVTEPEFLISSHGLGDVIRNLGILTKSAKCRVHFLGPGMSNADETYVGRGR